MVPRRNPLTKGLPRAQNSNQIAGNTSKRVRQTQWDNPTSPTRTRPSKTRRIEATDASAPATTPAAAPGMDHRTPARSRWGIWQTQLSSPESPESPKDTRIRDKHKPTRTSGLQGSSRLDLRGKDASKHPHQSREGQSVAGSTGTSIPGARVLPPELGKDQGTLPWELRPRDSRRRRPR